jgi:hypothetical protein
MELVVKARDQTASGEIYIALLPKKEFISLGTLKIDESVSSKLTQSFIKV